MSVKNTDAFNVLQTCFLKVSLCHEERHANCYDNCKATVVCSTSSLQKNFGMNFHECCTVVE